MASFPGLRIARLPLTARARVAACLRPFEVFRRSLASRVALGHRQALLAEVATLDSADVERITAHAPNSTAAAEKLATTCSVMARLQRIHIVPSARVDHETTAVLARIALSAALLQLFPAAQLLAWHADTALLVNAGLQVTHLMARANALLQTDEEAMAFVVPDSLQRLYVFLTQSQVFAPPLTALQQLLENRPALTVHVAVREQVYVPVLHQFTSLLTEFASRLFLATRRVAVVNDQQTTEEGRGANIPFAWTAGGVACLEKLAGRTRLPPREHMWVFDSIWQQDASLLISLEDFTCPGALPTPAVLEHCKSLHFALSFNDPFTLVRSPAGPRTKPVLPRDFVLLPGGLELPMVHSVTGSLQWLDLSQGIRTHTICFEASLGQMSDRSEHNAAPSDSLLAAATQGRTVRELHLTARPTCQDTFVFFPAFFAACTSISADLFATRFWKSAARHLPSVRRIVYTNTELRGVAFTLQPQSLADIDRFMLLGNATDGAAASAAHVPEGPSAFAQSFAACVTAYPALRELVVLSACDEFVDEIARVVRGVAGFEPVQVSKQ